VASRRGRKVGDIVSRRDDEQVEVQ
jgi:hypothetical protein